MKIKTKRTNDPAKYNMTPQRSINTHIDKMGTLQLWKAHNLQYVLRQAGPGFRAIPVVATDGPTTTCPQGLAEGDANLHSYQLSLSQATRMMTDHAEKTP